MNLGELRARCQVRFRDLSSVVVTAPQWRDHLNAVNRLFARAVRWPDNIAHQDGTVAVGERLLTVGAQALASLEQVYDLTHGRVLEILPPAYETRYKQFISDQTGGEPTFWRAVGTDLYIIPGPVEDTELRIYYFTDPPALVNDGDSPTFSERYHEALVVGAVAKALRDDQNFDAAAQLQSEYDAITTQADRKSVV